MGTTLVIGTRSLCAASFAAWLVLRRAGLRCNEIVVPLRQPDSSLRLRELSPTGSVPALLLDGVPIAGPMGIADHAAWRLPTLWPEPEHRALARRSALAAVNALGELATFLPMDLTARFTAPGPLIRPVADGVARLVAIWDDCRSAAGSNGPFLFGRFGVVDAMMAPWAARLTTHAIPLQKRHAAYVKALQALPEWAEWERAANGRVEPQAEAEPASRPAAVVPPIAEPAPEPVAEPEIAAPPPRAPERRLVEVAAVEPPPAAPPVAQVSPPPSLAKPGSVAMRGQRRPMRRPGFVEAPTAPSPSLRRRPIRTEAGRTPEVDAERPRRRRAVLALVAVALAGAAAALFLPQAIGTITAVTPQLHDALEPLSSRDEATLPAALLAPEPTEDDTILHPRVVVHYSGDAREADAAQRLARQLEEKGYVVALRPVEVRIARPSVRYYFADDRAATVALAASVEQSLDGSTNPRVLDLSHQRSKPKPGTLEVWIGPTRS